MDKLTITLTEEQSLAVREFWSKHGSDGKAMIAQPFVRNDGDLLKVGVVSEAAAMRIKREIDIDKQARAVNAGK